MDERRDGLRSGREAAGLISDAVMSALAQLVERLRDVAPDPAVTAPAARATPDAPDAQPAPPASRAAAPAGARQVPARAAADLVGGVVAAIVPAVLSRIDPDEILDRVDVQRVVDRVDVEEVVRRIDLDELAGRLDVDALLARVDVDALVARVDLAAATREAMDAVDIGELMRDSTATIGSDVVEGVRSQAMRADDLLARWVDRALRRRGPRGTAREPGGDGP